MCPLPFTAVCRSSDLGGSLRFPGPSWVSASLRGSTSWHILLPHRPPASLCPLSSLEESLPRATAASEPCSAPAGRPARNSENRKVGLLLSAQQPNRPQEAALCWKGVRRGSTVGTGEAWPSQEGPVLSFLMWLQRRTCLSGHLVDFRTHKKPFAQSAQPTRMHA